MENITPSHASWSSPGSLWSYGPVPTSREGMGSRTQPKQIPINLHDRTQHPHIGGLTNGKTAHGPLLRNCQKGKKSQHAASFLAVMASIQSQGEKDRAERGVQEEARQRSGCGSSMTQMVHSKRVRGERRRGGCKRVS